MSLEITILSRHSFVYAQLLLFPYSFTLLVSSSWLLLLVFLFCLFSSSSRLRILFLSVDISKRPGLRQACRKDKIQNQKVSNFLILHEFIHLQSGLSTETTCLGFHKTLHVVGTGSKILQFTIHIMNLIGMVVTVF